MYNSLATFRDRASLSSSLNEVRIRAHSFVMTSLSSAAVRAALIERIKSRSLTLDGIICLFVFYYFEYAQNIYNNFNNNQSAKNQIQGHSGLFSKFIFVIFSVFLISTLQVKLTVLHKFTTTQRSLTKELQYVNFNMSVYEFLLSFKMRF